jgi:hypothetical protein
MSEQVYTPGPWRTHVAPHGVMVVDESNNVLALMMDDDTLRKLVNADMMAAAPDMVEFIARMRYTIAGDGDSQYLSPTMREFVDGADAVLKKAGVK